MSGLTVVVAKTLSDIEFLAKKEFDGKLRTAEGNVTAAGDIATLTANSGKDMYLATAKVIFISEDTSSAAAIGDEVVLEVNLEITCACQNDCLIYFFTSLNLP